jgi:hypothetical protein
MPSGYGAHDKQVTLHSLVERVPDGASLALGGSFLHRGRGQKVADILVGKLASTGHGNDLIGAEWRRDGGGRSCVPVASLHRLEPDCALQHGLE